MFGILNNKRFPLKSVATRAYYKNTRRYVKTAAIDSAFFIHHFLYQLLTLIPPIPPPRHKTAAGQLIEGARGGEGLTKEQEASQGMRGWCCLGDKAGGAQRPSVVFAFLILISRSRR